MITKKYIGYLILMIICCFSIACDQSMNLMTSMTDMQETDTQPPDSPPLLTPLEQAQAAMDNVNRVRWDVLDGTLMKDFTSFQWEVHHAFANALLTFHDIGEIEEEVSLIDGSTEIVLSPLGGHEFHFQDQLLLIWLSASYTRAIVGIDDIEIDADDIDANSLLSVFGGTDIGISYIDVLQTLSPIPGSEASFNAYLDFTNSIIGTSNVEEIDRESYVQFLMAHDPILTEYLRLYFEYPEEDTAAILERFTAYMITGDIGIAYPEFLWQDLMPAEE
ncbi:hypothetical protein F4009_04585 [Candidatus Poribacteria bacterium]|nr:hypothetical protein [Candidatus Poribacteria bacterium]MYH80724.1 hypothetical protein [Candidatus Poribacteria bacterium]MYK93266.1 hypothetical protein [Candidatus Poribacteria bacterium]